MKQEKRSDRGNAGKQTLVNMRSSHIWWPRVFALESCKAGGVDLREARPNLPTSLLLTKDSTSIRLTARVYRTRCPRCAIDLVVVDGKMNVT